MPGSTRLGLVGGGTISAGQVVLASVAIPDASATSGSGTDADGSDATDASPTGPASSPKPKRSAVSSSGSACSARDDGYPAGRS